MNRLAALVVAHTRLFSLLALFSLFLLILLVTVVSREYREASRLTLLTVQTERMSVDLMAQTVNGNLMGALHLLGLADPQVKQDALHSAPSGDTPLLRSLEQIGSALEVTGLYVVDRQGEIHTFWGSGKSLTGVNVLFRPYVQNGLQGMSSVYAAVGTTSGERTLYFAAPLYEGYTPFTPIIGVVAARMNLLRIDRVLANHSDIALLLSPQGLIFASNRPEWIAHRTVAATPEWLQAIRSLKQFGTLFEHREPEPFPVNLQLPITEWNGNRYAIARTSLQWQDPGGNWQLILMENLTHTVPLSESVHIGLLVGSLAALVLISLFHVLQSHHRQQTAHLDLQRLLEEQATVANRKAQRAALSLRLQQCQSPHESAPLFLQAAHEQFALLQGVIYVRESDQCPYLQLVATFACQVRPASQLLPGEGLLGQAFLEGKMRLLHMPEDSFCTIHSGLGDARPSTLLLMPITLNKSQLGLLEVAMLHQPSASDVEELQEWVTLLALHLELRRSHLSLPNSVTTDSQGRSAC
ncbi:GAF domain-containing protein [Candidatus Magnetaquicoccus inordinatus]|uniref:GAF domain-containing protein n=1 Tax=Candidatus Magnetaquicoccus inordinatus TaxID=2496818 RepID=UPI00102CA753|nr:GAF domain-containing protein [Candidatus Magnetaquicoccus inordinatus]